MRLAIADPPYPPSTSEWVKRRASRWYGHGLAASDARADFHPDASEWDAPERHRRLVCELTESFDGWAIATSADGIAVYADLLPAGTRLMAWVKPNGQPGAHRLRSCWEPVILFPPRSRRSNRNGRGAIDDTLIAPAPRVGFVGAKPAAWTRWVLDAMSYEQGDEVVDLFPGSGSVSDALASVQSSLFDRTTASEAPVGAGHTTE